MLPAVWASGGILVRRDGGEPPRLALAVGVALLVALAAWAYAPILSLGLLGWDTYPLIASSRVLEWRDLLGNFTEELMDGRYTGGRMHRPVANLTFALDHALHGSRPLGYHVTDLSIFAGAAAALAAVMHRLFGRSWGMLLAIAFFALHPLQLELLPASSRRPDMLAILFTLLALRLWPKRGEGKGGAERGWKSRIPSSVCVLLALASKENGAIALPLVAAWHLLSCECGALRGRIAGTLRACLLPAALVALLVALRLSVLGGLGGHPDSSLSGALAQWPAGAAHYVGAVMLPQCSLESAALETAIRTALWIALLLPLAVWGHHLLATNATRPGPGVGSFFLLLAIWLVGTALLTAGAGDPKSWYATAYVPIAALFWGGTLNFALGLARCGRGRGAALVSAAVVSSLVAALRFSPALHAYDDWERLDRRVAVYLDRFEAKVRETPRGEVAFLPGAPYYEWSHEKVGLERVAGISDYGLEAYAELVLPEYDVRVVPFRRSSKVLPTPGAVTIRIAARMPPR